MSRPHTRLPVQRRAARRLGRTALYRHYDATDALLYVGISSDPVARTHAHKSADWADRVVRFTGEWFDTWAEAHAAERRAIRDEKPLFNRVRYALIVDPQTSRSQLLGPSVRACARFDPEMLTIITEAARDEGIDFSEMVRRMLAFALDDLPMGWRP